MNYTYAWLVIGGAGVLGALGLWMLTRGISNGPLRAILRLVPPLMMLLPAPVPNYDGQLAPAFIVFAFESLFQAEGEPRLAGLILLAGLVAGVVVGALIGRTSSPPATRQQEA